MVGIWLNPKNSDDEVYDCDRNDGLAGFELVQSFAWGYADLDRLTDETFDLGNDGSTTGDYMTMYSFDLKPDSRYDLFKDADGNVYVKPRGNRGPGDFTGISLREL